MTPIRTVPMRTRRGGAAVTLSTGREVHRAPATYSSLSFNPEPRLQHAFGQVHDDGGRCPDGAAENITRRPRGSTEQMQTADEGDQRHGGETRRRRPSSSARGLKRAPIYAQRPDWPRKTNARYRPRTQEQHPQAPSRDRAQSRARRQHPGAQSNEAGTNTGYAENRKSASAAIDSSFRGGAEPHTGRMSHPQQAAFSRISRYGGSAYRPPRRPQHRHGCGICTRFSKTRAARRSRPIPGARGENHPKKKPARSRRLAARRG